MHPPPPAQPTCVGGCGQGPVFGVGRVSGDGARGLGSSWVRGRPKPSAGSRLGLRQLRGFQRKCALVVCELPPGTPILACRARVRLSFLLRVRWALCFRRVVRAVEAVSRHLLLPPRPRVPALPARRCPRFCCSVSRALSHAEWEWLGVRVPYAHVCCKALTLGGACLVIHCVSFGPGQPFCTHLPPPQTPDLQVIPTFLADPEDPSGLLVCF